MMKTFERQNVVLVGLLWIFLSMCVKVSVVAQQQQHDDIVVVRLSNEGDDPNGFMSTATCCNQTIANNTHRVEVEFTTSVVQNEYIVRFDKYYKSNTREKYVKAAFNQSQVNILHNC